METESSTPALNWKHIAVIGLGVLAFVLLFIADKTNLNSGPEVTEPVEKAPVNGESNTDSDVVPAQVETSMLLPPPADPKLESLSDSLSEAVGKEKSLLLQRIAERLMILGRPDLASVYAVKLAESDESVRNLRTAGAMSRTALRLDEIARDTSLYRKFALQSIDLLQRAESLDPKDEGTKIELGLAYIQSRIGSNSMTGIMKLSEVLELNPDNAEAAFHLGKFSMQVGKYDKAEERFRTVIRVDPDNVEAKWLLAGVFMEQGKVDDAKPLLEELNKQNQDQMLANEAAKVLDKIKNQ